MKQGAETIDVCNGDADGLCAVLQMRLWEPCPARLITGLKREIELLQHVEAAPDAQVLVCDISMRRNLAALKRLLASGVCVQYFDHHAVDEIPEHPLLHAYIDISNGVCTSLLVDRYLKGKFRPWALVGAFGDHVNAVAERMALGLGLTFGMRRRLQSLGEAINYNAYGETQQDVHIAPAELYQRMLRYTNPLDFLEMEAVARELIILRQEDLNKALTLEPHFQNARSSVFLMPDTPWSRRIRGTLGNILSSAEPTRAHALLKPTQAGSWMVSVRAPESAPHGAAEFCHRFGGDGRAAAAGVDNLPEHEIDDFTLAFAAHAWGHKGVG